MNTIHYSIQYCCSVYSIIVDSVLFSLLLPSNLESCDVENNFTIINLCSISRHYLKNPKLAERDKTDGKREIL